MKTLIDKYKLWKLLRKFKKDIQQAVPEFMNAADVPHGIHWREWTRTIYLYSRWIGSGMANKTRSNVLAWEILGRAEMDMKNPYTSPVQKYVAHCIHIELTNRLEKAGVAYLLP